MCSDELDKCMQVKNRFKDKVIFYDALRSPNSTPLHSHPSYLHRNNNPDYQYKIAEDVIIETYLMSKADLLLCSTASNVNHLAQAINPKLKLDILPYTPAGDLLELDKLIKESI